ncbi:hypothetical protein [Helicobacter sp.]|uniref:hypothetical protein n=1 Tax=Helicobacter sp. TaxID=218 RepID=UPI00388DEFAC
MCDRHPSLISAQNAAQPRFLIKNPTAYLLLYQALFNPFGTTPRILCCLFESPNPTAYLLLYQALFPSLRALRQQGVAIHKSTQVDSKAVNSATAESMDCHADKSARNDSKNAPSKKMDSSYNAPLSSQADTAPSPSLRADEIGVAKQGAAAASLVIHKQEKQKGT